jgi:hypothetical protein
MNVFLTVDVLVNINRERDVVVNKVGSLSLDHIVVWIQGLFLEGNVLKRSQGFTNFLNVVAVLVLFGSVLSLVCVGVVLASSLDFVLLVSRVFVDQESFLNFRILNLEFSWEDWLLN